MSAITTINASDLITNSRDVINNNFAALNAGKIETSVIDTDATLAANSDAKIPSQKAVKAYVDALAGQTYLVPTGAVLPYVGATAPANFLLCDGSNVSRGAYAILFGIIGTTFGAGDGVSTFGLPNMKNRIPVGAGTATVIGTFVSRASNVLTLNGLTNAANNEFQTGQAVIYHTAGSVITGLTNDATYYLVRTGNLTFSLASSLANAQNAVVISLSSDGSGVQTFTLTYATRTRGDKGGEENHALSLTELTSHTHTIADSAQGPGGNTGGGTPLYPGGTTTTSAVGGNAAMNNMQPFIVMNYIIKT